VQGNTGTDEIEYEGIEIQAGNEVLVGQSCRPESSANHGSDTSL
jgi:hypothetical protein